jgi:hypothetical protein
MPRLIAEFKDALRVEPKPNCVDGDDILDNCRYEGVSGGPHVNLCITPTIYREDGGVHLQICLDNKWEKIPREI